MAELIRRIRETLSEVAAAAADAERFCAEAGAEEGQCLRIGLALDELAANALIHGAEQGAQPDIQVRVWSDAEMLHLEVAAQGPRFDPTGHRPTDPAEPYALGGRGLAMVLAFADQLSYARKGEANITTFSVTKRSVDA